MSNDSLAGAFARLAQLLELTGADSFRSGAHARAARTIEAQTTDLSALALQEHGRNRLLDIEGIGPKIADKIIEYAKSGHITELDELTSSVPPGLLKLLEIQGMGPKTIRMFWQDAGVTDLASLNAIIADGSILKLPRMGAKSVDKLKASIAMLSESAGRLHLGPAWTIAHQVCERLRTVKGVTQVEPAGSLRRGRDTIGDIDILASVKTPEAGEALAEAFCTQPGVKQVLSRGPGRCSIRLALAGGSRWDSSEEGKPETSAASVQVDLRLIDQSHFGAALLYFTGSKEHNVQLRQRALDMGLTLNDYGLFPDDPKHKQDKPPQQRGVKPVAAKAEADIYAALKLPYLPPEIREARGELELKETPKLIELEDIKAELHAHTTASDGVMSIVQLATEAKRRGFHTIAVTDHSQSSAIAGGLKPKRLREHISAIRSAQKELDGITILAGSEVDILADGSLDYDDDLLAELDVVVASPHAALTQDSATATARLLKAIAHPLVHILGHPTGRLVMRRKGLEPDINALIAAAKEHDVALEINAHWMRLDLRDTHVRAAIDAGCHIAIDCDVHHPDDFDNLRFGIATARRGWATAQACINTWSAKKLHGWLKEKRR